VTEEEIRLAKTYARAATVGEIEPEAAENGCRDNIPVLEVRGHIPI